MDFSELFCKTKLAGKDGSTVMNKQIREAYYLAEDACYGRGWSPAPASGWWYDNRGARTQDRNYAPFSISNVSGEAPTGMVRELRKTSEGVVTVIATVNIESGFDGLFIRLYDSDKNDAACLYTKDGSYVALGKNQKETVLRTESNPLGAHVFKIVLDFDSKKTSYYIDNTFAGAVPLTAKYIKFYKIGTFAGHVLDVQMRQTVIHANYFVNEHFALNPASVIPEGWEAACDEDASALANGADLVLTSENRAQALISKKFAPVSGKVCFESFFFMPEIKDGAKVALLSGGKPVLEFYTENGNFCAAGKTLRYALNEMWYRLRFEIDTAKKNALIKVNGKNLETVKLTGKCDSIDEIVYSLCADSASLQVDNIKLFPLIEYADYCPKPKLPKGKDDYVIGMNMCSLWHTGSHVGWDCITPYKEIKPVLGYYDEGIPEVADWEIKFMLEHGVDFQLYCWYSSQTNAPIKRTGLSEAIHDGYFNCKYSDMTKFALLWEAANAAHPAGSEAFRRYFVPYWIEQFFSDKRYMTIDNKAVMAVFGTWQLIKDFGSPEGVKAEFDYLRGEVKKLGYDDLIIMSCGGPSAAVRDCGFDAAYAYNWGKQGYDAEYTSKMINAQQDMNLVHIVPTASTGFNNVAWAETRSPNMTVEDFKALHTEFRDKMLPSFKDKPDWTHRFIMMSNWNEYGEGTYIMPCKGLNGFGYLDAVRDVYTKEKGEHTDDVPTPNQLSRLSYLYPQERKMLRTLDNYKEPEPDRIVKAVNFTKGNLAANWEILGCTAAIKNGAIKGVSDCADPQLISKTPFCLKLGSFNKVTHVRIRAKVSKPTNIELFYITESGPSYTQNQSFGVTLTPDKTYGICPILRQPNLDTPVIGLRIDPVSMEGVEFEFYGFDLMASSVRPEFELNGEKQPINSPVQVKNGYTLLPFNPYHVLVYRLGLYYEYVDKKKELSFYSKDASIVFTLGERTVVINGEKTLLNAPIECFDGLPLLPLEVMSKVFGFKFTYKAPKLSITTK